MPTIKIKEINEKILHKKNNDKTYHNSFGSGSVKIGCYDDITEVLTVNGWKLFKDVNIESDEIITMDKNRNVIFEYSTKYFTSPYKGDMYHFENEITDLLVTPNHRMVIYNYNQIIFKTAEELSQIEDYHFNLPIHIPMDLHLRKVLKEHLANFLNLFDINDNRFVAENENMKNDIITTLFIFGYRYKIKKVGDIYKISKVANLENIISSDTISKKTYEGNIYCLEVPNGILCVKRNNKIAWCGNSLGVVTINIPRAAVKSNGNEEVFLKELTNLGEVCCDINNAKRNIIKKRIDNGNIPLYDFGFMSLNKQYSTIGATGIYEAVKEFNHDITTTEGTNFVLRIIKTLNDVAANAQNKFKAPHNLEQVPAENSSIRLCEKDTLFGYNPKKIPFYSNQFVPLIVNVDMLERIRLQGIFDKEFSGGAIAHINLDARLNNSLDMEHLIERCVNDGVIYWAANYNTQRCENGHMRIGKSNECDCGAKITDNFQRVVGFLTNVENWNKVRRKKDYPNRQHYKKIKLKNNEIPPI